MDFKPRIDSHFGLKSISSSIIEPSLYHVNKSKKPDYSVKYKPLSDKEGSVYYVRMMGKSSKFFSTDKIMNKLTHETVADLLDGNTDVKLSTIGIKGADSRLTPDVIDESKRLIIELTTTKVDVESEMRARFALKLNHYEEAISGSGYSLGVLVVSTDSVFSNLELSQETVDALCHRCRAGLGVHSMIEKLEGRPLILEDQTYQQSIIKSVVKELGRKPAKSNKDFPINEIMQSTKEPSRVELKKASKIILKCLKDSKKRSIDNRDDVQKYIESYNESSRTDMKRISNIPMVIGVERPQTGYSYRKYVNDSTMPDWLKFIWNKSGVVKRVEEDYATSYAEAMGLKEFEQHKIQKSQCFYCKMPEDLMEKASATGLWGKSMKNTETYIEHKEHTKKSFHPTETPTQDIEDFINSEPLNSIGSICDSVPEDIMELIKDSKRIWDEKESLSVEVLSNISKTKMVRHASLISRLFTEICYCYKYWIKRSDFYKKWVGNVQMLVRCTGDFVFVSYAFPKSEFESYEFGRIGPSLYEDDNYIYTDFCSYTEPDIEHFVKAGPYITSIIAHLQSTMETPLNQIHEYTSHVQKTAAGIYLLFLNNKSDVEELITNQRYLTMTVLEDLDPNPYRFVERLPAMYKSRLTCYVAKRTLSEIDRYSHRQPVKMIIEDSGIKTLDYDWLRGIFSAEPVNFRQKVNEFYFGYVVSKEKGRGSDRNFKIMKKIVEQEYKYIDDNHPVFGDGEDPVTNQTNMNMLKLFMKLYRKILEDRYGEGWKEMVERTLVEKLASVSFLEVATLKVSSRNYDTIFNIPFYEQTASTSEIREKLKAANQEDVKPRPRVMESLSSAVESYLIDTKLKDVDHIFQLTPWALNRIEIRGFFYSDIFPKPQHGGDREIHVLEILARLIQLYVEKISRTLCEMVPSDSLTHPGWKDGFVRNHYNQADINLDTKRLTMGKSADASKWCQRNHCSKFASFLVGVLPSNFHVGVLRVLTLWTSKVIVFPIQFVANFLSNRKVKSNKIYERMRTEFFSGTGIFNQPCCNRMTIKSGMMQGILHYTSSFVHGVIQSVGAIIVERYLKSKNIQCVVTIVQGSDDSAQLLTVSGPYSGRKLAEVATIMLHWKEKMSAYFSIYTSRAKSCIGSSDMIEYNSEWSIRKTTFKPTFRWVSSCLEVGIVEKFIDRIHNFYNTATTVLEGGGSVLETAIVQCCQAWMHYSMLGIGNHVLSKKVSNLLCNLKDPALGYFPTDSDFSAGMVGVDFLLFCLFKRSKFGYGVRKSALPDTELDLFDEDIKDSSMSQDLRRVRLKFGNHSIFQKILRDMSVPELNELIEAIEKDPELLYYPESNWKASRTRIFMKVFEPGVKESLSRHSATARILSASAYLISRPCLFIAGEEKKMSLFMALITRLTSSIKDRAGKLEEDKAFIHSAEYNDILKDVSSLSGDHTVQSVKMKARSKHEVVILDREIFDIPIMELCKQMWFDRGGKTGLSDRQAFVKWAEAKEKYPFLKNKRSETKLALGMSEVQLKNFLESLTSRPRKVVLLDTAAKGGSLKTVLSRVFWPNTKLHLEEDLEYSGTAASIRSRLFAVVTHWMTNVQKSQEIVRIFQEESIFKDRKVPHKMQKLKHMADYYNGKSRSDVIREIVSSKTGAVGFFTIRQNGWGWNRTGLGEWKGKILDSSVKINFMNSTCESIVVDNLQNASELGRLLKDFIDSSCSKFPTTLQESSHWLTKDGRINGGRGSMTAIPIKLDPDLTVITFEDMSERDWFLEVNHNVIRLKASFPQGVNITILSDRLRSNDWDPLFKVDESLPYANWNNSEPYSMSKIEEELSPVFNGSRSQVLKQLRNLNNVNSSTGWNLNLLRQCMLNFFNLQITEADMTIVNEETGLPKEEEEAFMNELMSGSFEFNWEETLTFEDEADDDEVNEIFETNSDLIDDSLELLMAERESKSFSNDNTMPPTNRCFAYIDTLSRSMLGTSFREQFIDFLKNDHFTVGGILGKILTLLTGHSCMMHTATVDDVDAYRLEEDSVSLMTSVKTEKDLDDMSEEVILSNIKYIQEKMKDAPEFLRMTYAKSKSSLEHALALKRAPPSASAIGEVKTNDFLTACKPLLKKTSTRLSVATHMDDNFFLPICRKELDDHVIKLVENGNISELEMGVYRESVSKSMLTTLFVDLISSLCETNIKVREYSCIFKEDDDVFEPDI